MTRKITIKADAAPSTPPGLRSAVPVWAQRILGPLVFGSVAAACVPLGILPVLACAKAIASGAALDVLRPREAVTIPLCIAFSLFAAMCALLDTQIRLRPSRRSATALRADRIATVMFAGGGMSMLMVPLAPLIASVSLAWAAAGHAYVACPPLAGNRYGVMRWAHDASACPEGQ